MIVNPLITWIIVIAVVVLIGRAKKKMNGEADTFKVGDRVAYVGGLPDKGPGTIQSSDGRYYTVKWDSAGIGGRTRSRVQPKNLRHWDDTQP